MPAYILPGREKDFWVVTLTTPSAPGAVEINAGTELTDKLQQPAEITTGAQVSDSSDLSSARDKGQRGTIDIGRIVLRLKRDTGTETAYAAMDEGDEGYLVRFRKGTAGAAPAFADVCDVYPAQVNLKTPGTPGRNEVDYEMFELVVYDEHHRDVSCVTT